MNMSTIEYQSESQQTETETAVAGGGNKEHPRTGLAPYYHALAPEARCPGEYGVLFQPGHTLEKHFDFLGLKFEIMFELNMGYVAMMDDQLFNAVRYDPGVRLIEEDSCGTLEGVIAAA